MKSVNNALTKAIDKVHDAILDTEASGRPAGNLMDVWMSLKAVIEPSPGEANSEAEHLRMQIGYLVTQLMLRGDTRTLPEIVEEAAKATASSGAAEGKG